MFIRDHRSFYSVGKMCELLRISRKSFYQWVNKDYSSKHPSIQRTLTIKEEIQRIYDQSKGRYGSCRIRITLRRSDIYLSRSYVARLMNRMGLKSILKKKFKATTDSRHDYPVAPNLLNREFRVEKLGSKWVSDITYIKVLNRWAYLTTVIDLADRQVIGWALSEDMTTENTVLKAWTNARNNRDIQKGFIFHSDRGSQYASNLFRNIFIKHCDAKQSMSRKGNCWDNAVAESFFKTIKYECLNHT
ncbi:IS3 family transposase [Halosquirtibacter xylanolyticus]|uniref:IS3 family transposase n=1 Tax=Halosquirtibacter xylanolyticus TaxID=3374599 RepID=UPI003749F7DF